MNSDSNHAGPNPDPDPRDLTGKDWPPGGSRDRKGTPPRHGGEPQAPHSEGDDSESARRNKTEGNNTKLKDLVAECLLRMEDEGPSALEDTCAKHPELADAIRSRVSNLAASGLLEKHPTTPPSRIGDFVLGERIGGGGMGVVYEATQVSLNRDVALKVVRPEMLFFDGTRRRFAREVEAVARLQHPGIVPVIAAGEDQGTPYLAMERVPGATLGQVLQALADRAPATLTHRDLLVTIPLIQQANRPASRKGAEPGSSALPLRPGDSWTRTILGLGIQAAAALDHAHARGVLHRDMKPSNLMVTSEGRVLVVDFGLAFAEGDARITSTGGPLGSLAYMSPEQVRGQRIDDVRCDVYGLGVTLYELLTLRAPFSGRSFEELRQQILVGRPPSLRTINPDVSAELETVVLTAMETDPGRRYPSATAMQADLQAVLDRKPIAARPAGAWLRARRWMQRHPARSVAAILGTLLLFGLPLTWALTQRRESQRTTAALERARAHLADAQEAVDVMLSEVARDELEFIPGTAEVRKRILRKALQFSLRLSEREGNSPDLQQAAARATFRVAMIHTALEEEEEAARFFDVALARAHELLARDPNDPVGLELTARALMETASLADRNSQMDLAQERRKRAETAFELWHELTGDQPATWGLAGLFYHRAVYQMNRGRHREALESLHQAMPLLRERVAVHPTDQEAKKHLALALSAKGAGLEWLQQDRDADPVLRESLALSQALLDKRPGDWETMHNLGITSMSLGRALTDVGEFEQASQQYASSIDFLSRVRRIAPETSALRLPLSMARGSLAALQVQRGEFDLAEEQYAQSIALLEEELWKADPPPRVVADLGLGLLAYSQLLRQTNKLEQSLTTLDEAIDLQREALDYEPGNQAWRNALFHQLHTRGLVLLDLNQVQGCADDARAIRALTDAEPSWIRTAASLLARCAERQPDDRSAEEWKDQALTWLEELVREGGDHVDSLANSHFSALEGEPRFEALLKRLRKSP